MAETLPMTAGRRLALAIGVPLALAVFGWTGISLVSLVGEASYPVRLHVPVHGDRASVVLGDTDARLSPGSAGQLAVTGTAHYALIKSHVTWTSSAAGVSLHSQCQQFTGQCSFSYRIAVPPVPDLTIHDSDGNLTLAGLANQRISVENSDGDITGDGLTASWISATDGSGNIRLPGLTSAVVTVRNSDGDVTLSFASVPSAVRITDSSGNVHIALPPGATAYRVTVSTPDGSNTVHVPTSSASRHVITVTDLDGSVSIGQ
jgi:hypothetical protein